MSAVCLGLITVLCLFCTSLAQSVDHNGVIWRPIGGSVSIHCRYFPPVPVGMLLSKGIKKDLQVLFLKSKNKTIHSQFTGRLRVEGNLPNVDVVISNLTSEDMGLYWCGYEWFDVDSLEPKKEDGNGSVLLVVTEDEQECGTGNPNQNLLLVTVVVSVAVLFGVFIAFVLWGIPKIKKWHIKYRPQHRITNDIYEDMRGTLRH